MQEESIPPHLNPSDQRAEWCLRALVVYALGVVYVEVKSKLDLNYYNPFPA